jgi:hypothetical protein
MALSQVETMTGTRPGAKQPVLVDRSAQRLVFTVQWAPPTREALDIEVFRPDGTAAIPDSKEKTPQSSIKMFNVKASDVGTWTVRAVRGINKSTEAVPYVLRAMMRERHLDYLLSTSPGRPGTGDKITVRAVIDWDGKPLTGLPPGAIRVRVQRPGAGIGTILHNARSTDKSTGTIITPAGDIQMPYDRKVAAAINRGELKRIVPADFATIELKEQGHGVYSATFDRTTIAGTYGFEAVLDWDTERTAHTRRVERTETLVHVRPDPAKTDVTITRVDARTVTIAVTPRDKAGNYLGPGYAPLVKAKLSGDGRLAGPVDRDQTGTYVFTAAGLPANQMPDVTITVDGVAVGVRKP